MNKFADHPLVGKRIRLRQTDDPYTLLRPGDQGTVTFVDDLGDIGVAWDNGEFLKMLPGDDKYDILEPTKA